MLRALSSLYGGRGVSLVRGEGAYVWDENGRRYIDFFNGHGAALFGHGAPALVDALCRAAHGIWSSGAGCESPAREEAARLLAEEIGGGRVFFCNSGTEAIEAALKLAAALKGGRREIIACRRAFHGRSCGSLGLTFNPKYRAPFAALIPAVKHYAPEEVPAKISEETLAVFVEPVQGEGGVYPIPPEVGRAISEACRANGAFLVADEVQSGLGRCGAFFASQGAGLSPDVVCVAKGLAGGMAVGAAIWREELGDFPPHSHGSTYGGNELAMNVALAALKYIKEKDLCAHAAKMGELIRSEISKRDIPGVAAVRGRGLLIGAETKGASQEIVRALQWRGLLSSAAGPRVVRFLPSFAVTEETALAAVDIFEKTMKEMGGGAR